LLARTNYHGTNSITRVPQLSQLANIKSLSEPITRCCHPLIVDGAAAAALLSHLCCSACVRHN